MASSSWIFRCWILCCCFPTFSCSRSIFLFRHRWSASAGALWPIASQPKATTARAVTVVRSFMARHLFSELMMLFWCLVPRRPSAWIWLELGTPGSLCRSWSNVTPSIRRPRWRARPSRRGGPDPTLCLFPCHRNRCGPASAGVAHRTSRHPIRNAETRMRFMSNLLPSLSLR